MKDGADYGIAYEHGLSQQRLNCWALDRGTFLPSRPCESCGQMLTIWAEEKEIDLELAQKQVQRELPQMVPCGHERRQPSDR